MTYDIDKAKEEQFSLCEKAQLPQFAPANGVCYTCHRNIYSSPCGYSVEEAATKYITRCPCCSGSFVD